MKTQNKCVCGHDKADHIYEEGACVPCCACEYGRNEYDELYKETFSGAARGFKKHLKSLLNEILNSAQQGKMLENILNLLTRVIKNVTK